MPVRKTNGEMPVQKNREDSEKPSLLNSASLNATKSPGSHPHTSPLRRPDCLTPAVYLTSPFRAEPSTSRHEPDTHDLTSCSAAGKLIVNLTLTRGSLGKSGQYRGTGMDAAKPLLHNRIRGAPGRYRDRDVPEIAHAQG